MKFPLPQTRPGVLRARFALCLMICALTISGCGLIYKQDVQQGNALEQEDLDELYLGMNKRQVLFVLGTPSVSDPFHDDRWDYVQTFARRGGDKVQRTVTLRFEDDLLSEIIGRDDPYHEDLDPTRGFPEPIESDEDKTASKSPDNEPVEEVINADDQPAEDAAAADSEPEGDASSRPEPEIKGTGERKSDTRDLDEDES